MDNQPITPPQPLPEQQVKSNLAWLKTLSIGFSLVSFGIAIGIGGYIFTTQKNQPAPQNQQAISLTPSPAEVSTKAEPTTDPTTNWKTYSSSSFKFSVKHPDNVLPEEEIIDEGDTPFLGTVNFVFAKENKGCVPHQYPGVIIGISKVPFGTNVRAALAEEYAGVGGHSGNEEDLKNVVIGGINGLRGELLFSETARKDNAYVVKEDKLYVFRLCTANEYFINHKEFFNSMLATFKFTDQK